MRESYFFLLWCLPIPTYICTHNSFIEKFCSATSSPPLGFPYLKKKRKKNSVNFQWSTKDVGQIFSYLSRYLLSTLFIHWEVCSVYPTPSSLGFLYLKRKIFCWDMVVFFFSQFLDHLSYLERLMDDFHTNREDYFLLYDDDLDFDKQLKKFTLSLSPSLSISVLCWWF